MKTVKEINSEEDNNSSIHITSSNATPSLGKMSPELNKKKKSKLDAKRGSNPREDENRKNDQAKRKQSVRRNNTMNIKSMQIKDGLKQLIEKERDVIREEESPRNENNFNVDVDDTSMKSRQPSGMTSHYQRYNKDKEHQAPDNLDIF